MPLVPAQCPNCSGKLNIDSEKDAAICQYCGTPFIVEKAITQYNTNNNFNIDNVTIVNNGNSDFEISGGVLKKYNGSSLTPVVPEGVVAIEGGVFENSMITEVTLPSTLKELRCCSSGYRGAVGSFFSCSYLEKVNLPEGLKDISSCVFKFNHSLKEITIPSTVDNVIGFEAFSRCENLEVVVFENHPSTAMWSKAEWAKAESSVFDWCTKLETVLYRENGVLVNPLDSYETLINSPFSNWDEVECTFRGTPFYQKYCDIRYKGENRCLKCGSVLSKRLFSNEYYCKNCGRK